MSAELRVCHVITGTDTGGAETMLAKLLPAPQVDGIASTVISLTDIGPVGRELVERGVPVHAMHMRKGPGDAARIFALRTRIARERPQVVQTWLHHADLLGGVAARMAGVRAVAWNLRQSNLDPAVNKAQTLYFARACALLSRWLPKRIVCCSHAALEAHAALGYDRRRMLVIVNGFDLDRFAPSDAARERVRRELAIGARDLVIAMIARFDPQKDHRNFVDAAARIAEEWPGTHFVLAGEGVDSGNAALCDWIGRVGPSARWHLLGRRDDVAGVLAAADVAVSASVGEGFPNAVGEAMACAVPCVVTDVGDSGRLVGDCGRVVPPRDGEALAAACGELARLAPEERRELGEAARRRIAENFALEHTRSCYHELYRELARLCAA